MNIKPIQHNVIFKNYNNKFIREINKISLKLFLVCCFTMLFNLFAFSQNSDSLVSDILLHKDFLPPLNVLIEEAKEHSPLLKQYDAEIDIREMKNKSLKRNWSKYISLGSSIQYGTYDNYALNTYSDGLNTLGAITTGQQSRYSVGVFVNLPVYSIYNRNNEINIGQKELEQVRFEKKQMIDQLVNLVVEQYSDVLLARKILILRNDNLNSINLQLAMSEQKFKSGQMKLSELVLIQGIQTKAKIDLEKEKNNFYKSLSLLEKTCGIKLNIK
ncbi:MAG: TolC family protein [Bacteroidales bacterium]|nr:TolC family protein [Bacteroidales bacterium]